MSDPKSTSKDGAAGRADRPEPDQAASAKVAHGTPAARAPGDTVLPKPPHSDEPMELKNVVEEAPEAKAKSAPPKDKKDAKAPDAKPKTAADGSPKSAEPEEPAKKKKKSVRPGRSAFSWFIAGLGLAIAVLGGLATWNVWSEPHYVLAPRLDALMQDYGGYLTAAGLFGLALVAAMLFRRRVAFIVSVFFLIVSAVVAAITTVLLGVGASVLCNRQPVFQAASPDRRLLVIGVQGKCGMTRELTYRVSVRELGPSFPRETTIFQSFGKPIPTEVAFSKDRTITVLVKGVTENGATRYTVTIDRATFRPDKVWRFDVRSD